MTGFLQVDIKASDLRHEMSVIALKAVQDFLDEHSTTDPPPENPEDETGWVFRDEASRAEFAQYMTSKYPLSTQKGVVPVSPMHFRDFQGQISDDGSDPTILSKSGLFEHPLILRVLGVYFSYVDAIPEGIERKEEKPFGALELAVQAVERALKFYHSGNPPSKDELAKKTNFFSYANWGAQLVTDWAGKTTNKLRANEFHKTIRNLPEVKWKAIVTGARGFMVGRRITQKKGRSKKRVSATNGDSDDSDDDNDDNGDVVMSDPPLPLSDNNDTFGQNQVASEARKEVHDEGAPDSNPSIAASDNIGANNDNGSGGNAADNKSDSDHEDIGNEGGGDEEGCSPVGEDKESIDGNREQDKENGRSDDDDSIGDDDAVQ
ncbi:hypothetical protein AAF712_016718 [Marasmius tenuissimus]|uniref:Uncharacterized protein n=1 Tax=Marasmius tenuissimus TaxID=585030 RepID=A0ABR2Z631_9AGAR